ncbi:MAG TPA: DUF4214 domain-containing protein [Fimbriiglobus sp.]|nr:DUF4214 domain-containing protein [Fimbriiglobus sp.]
MVKNMIAARIRDNLAWEQTQSAARPPADAEPQLTPDQLAAEVNHLLPLPAAEFGRGLYRVLLGREPSAAELDHLVSRAHAGAPRLVLVRELSADRNARDLGLDPAWSRSADAVWDELLRAWGLSPDRFAHRLYRLFLNRPADADGLATHVGAMARGQLRTDVVRAFITSPEFVRTGLEVPWSGRLVLLIPAGLGAELRAGRTDPDDRFVLRLYEAVLFRRPTPAELAAHLHILAAGTPRRNMVRAFLDCDEARGRYTGPEWTRFEDHLDARPDPSSYSPAELLGLPDPGEFVREAYRAVLGRYPSTVEYARQVRRLRYLPFYTRSRLLQRLSRTWEAEVSRRSWSVRDQAATKDVVGGDGGRLQRVVGEVAREQGATRQQLGAIERAVTESLALRIDDCTGRLMAIERAVASELSGHAVAVVQIGRDLHREVDALVRREQEAIRQQLGAIERAVAEGLAPRMDDCAGRLGAIEQAVVGELSGHAVAVVQIGRDLHREVDALVRRVQGFEQAVGVLLGDDPGGVRERLRRLEEAVGTSASAMVTEQQRLREVQEVMRAEQRQHAFAEQTWYDQLRRLGAAVAEHTATPAPTATPPTATKADRCRVCGGELEFRWTGRVLHNRYEAEYHECRVCGALQIPNPHWLAEAYKGEDSPQLWNPDTGRFRRNFSVYCHLRALVAAGLTGPRPRLLDYGGGYGLLTQMLLDSGLDAWTFDPHIGRPFFAPDRLITDPGAVTAGSFDLVSAFEVFEHLTDLAEVGSLLRRVLAPAGSVVLSTELYKPGESGPDWHYLSYDAGQHVLFWTRKALQVFAGRHGFRSVGFFPDGPFRCAILSPLPEAELGELLGRAAAEFGAAGFTTDVTRGWQVSPPGAGLVADFEPADGAGEGRP